ncbi:MAG: PAS domain-containing protein [Bacteroidota bacterium]
MGAADLGNHDASRTPDASDPGKPPGMLTRFDEAELPDDCARQLWRWWSAADRHAVPPRREDFDPTDFPRVLPGITIFQVERDPWRFRVRLVGTRIVQETSRDTTGVYLDQLENCETVAARASWAAESRQPYFMPAAPVAWTSRKYKHYSALALPLVDGSGRTCMILYYMSFA